jgi:hypothetical protein
MAQGKIKKEETLLSHENQVKTMKKKSIKRLAYDICSIIKAASQL